MTSKCEVPLTGVTADTDAGGLADIFDGELVDGFVSQRAGARDHADMTRFMNVTGGDANTATAGGVWASAGRDESGAVGSDKAGLLTLHGALNADHVLDRDAFRDGHGELELGINTFKNGVGRKRRGYKNGRDDRAGGSSGFGYGVEDRYLHIAVFEEQAAFAGRDARDDLSAVVDRETGMFTTKGTRDALDHDLGIGIN